MSELIARLRNPMMILHKAEVGEGADYMVLDEDQARADMAEAADEIEHLRSLAGAVTPGPTLADIKAKQCQCGAAGEPA